MRLSLYAAAAFLFASVTAYADPVTYTFSGTFSGSIGALTFNSDPGTITETTDTAATSNLGGGFYTNTGGISIITLDNIGSAIFLSPSFGAQGSQDTAGFYDISSGFGLSLYDPCLGQTDCAGAYDPTAGDYNLAAPFSDTGFFEESFAAAFGTTEVTTLGELNITGDAGTSATFTAVGATPEPSSFVLLGTGLLGALGAARRRLA